MAISYFANIQQINKMKQKLTITFVLFFIISTLSFGQEVLLHPRFEFETNLNYDNTIPSPKDFLGYELGTEFTLYAHMEQYIQKIASLSDRVQINQYGTTYEGRKLYNLVISSKTKIQNIESIRKTNLDIMDPVNHPEINLQEIAKETPVFVSFSYNIHGNEASSTEAAMQVLYRLASANDPETMDILNNAVFIMYPCINADGRDRYVYWYKGTKRSVLGKEPRDMEHYAPFPNGRTNHYWFDLNRDWIWGVHPESRGHTGEYIKWMPQVHTDYHEMGYESNYFTMPGTTPRNKLLPDAYEPLTDTIGKANIEGFNKYKSTYFTREGYDFFYPGYGSSYPSVMGAIGMLVEKAGISAGLAVENQDDYILTLRQRIFDHYTTSFATLKKAVERKDLFLEYGRNASDPSQSKSTTKSYIVKNNGNPYLSDFKNIMQHHGIKINQISKPYEVACKDYRSGNSGNLTLQPGDFIINTNQSKHLFIHSIMARNMAIEDSVMYDMATWSLPIAYNLEAYECGLTIPNNVIDALDKSAEDNNSSGVNEENDIFAATVNWNQRYAPKALAMLWEKGYHVRVAEKEFSVKGQKYAPGTLLILVERNWDKKNSIVEDLNQIANETNIDYDLHNTGRVEDGIDFGSNNFTPLKMPKVGMLVGPPFDTYSAGQIYFLFDQETAFPVERIRTEVLEQTALPKFGSRYGYANLFDYDVIILPDGGNGLKQLLGEEEQKIWKMWLEQGGTIIATESAAEFFTKSNSKIANLEIKSPKRDTSETAIYINYADRRDYYGKKRIPGSAVNSNVDVTHPLAFGIDPSLFTLKFGAEKIIPNSSFQTVVKYEKEENLLVAGYISDENIKFLSEGVGAGVLGIGRGKIVYLLDNTQYRMFWRGPSRMMQNAVMFNF